MNQEELDNILEKHKLWLDNKEEGIRANLENANLRNADLRNANLRNADLRNANLRNADLENANLWGANLRNADLENANLRNANLWDANLENANLWGADLRNADLRNANLNKDTTTIFGEKCEYYPIMINGLEYYIVVWGNYIKIGCKSYKKEEWRNFTDKEILAMDGKKALEFWKEYKEFILNIKTRKVS